MRFKIQKNDVVQFTDKTPYFGCFGQVVRIDFTTTNDLKYKILLRSPLPFDRHDYVWADQGDIEYVGIAPYAVKDDMK